MIVYHPAFDLYHAVYRMILLLTHFKRDDYVEIDRLRIWDYYVLFPNRMERIKISRTDNEIKTIIKTRIATHIDNPYERIYDDKKMFEKIKTYQMTAIKCLASYGIINKDYLALNKISVISEDILKKYAGIDVSAQEHNAIGLLTSYFYFMPLYGPNGLKARTQLIESKYDAE